MKYSANFVYLFVSILSDQFVFTNLARKKTMVYHKIAEAAAISPRQAKQVLDAIRKVIVMEVRESGSITLPNTASFKSKTKEATPGRTKKIMDKEVKIQPKPKRIILKVNPTKQLAKTLPARPLSRKRASAKCARGVHNLRQ